MHKKMLIVSEKAWSLPDSPGRKEALDQLWMGQGNCPYWHGVFGGAYLFHIRNAAFEHLLAAENAADALAYTTPHWVDWREMDLDRDASPDLLLMSDSTNLYFDLADGGSCVEWDWRARTCNLANVMSRRPEGYHRDLQVAAEAGQIIGPGEPTEGLESIHTTLVRVKERGLEKHLYYDWYRHASFVDHLLHAGTTVEDLVRARFGELGDFVNQPYGYSVSADGGALAAVLTRDGHVWQGECFCPLRVQKVIRIWPGSPNVEAIYTLTNTSQLILDPHLAVETVWALLGGNGPTASALVPGLQPFGLHEPATAGPAEGITLRLGWLQMEIALTFSRPAELLLFPLETISNSEAGFEATYQGTCLFTRWPVRLEPGEAWSVTLHCEPRTA
jgi:alpha-amylase